MFKLFERVHLLDADGKATKSSEIVGTYTLVRVKYLATPNQSIEIGYLVRLDIGFYNQAGNTYVDVLPVHPENLRKGE